MLEAVHWLNNPFFQACPLLYPVSSQRNVNQGSFQATKACLFTVL